MILDSKSTVDRIGDYLRGLQQYSDLNGNKLRELNDFRRLFHPIMAQVGRQCRRTVKRTLPVDQHESAIIAQRIKRLESIIIKLKRQQSMRLSSMVDIGGVRIILPDLSAVTDVAAKFKGRSNKLTVKKVLNYLEHPKEDGYRGIHLYVEADNEDEAAKSIFPRLTVELQVRSQYQHAWATAVEMMGMVNGRSYKTGDWEDDWKTFFKLVSDVFFYYEMGRTDVSYKSKLEKPDIFIETLNSLKQIDQKIHALEFITRVKQIQTFIVEERLTNPFIVLDMDFKNKRVEPYFFDDQHSALKFLALIEENYLEKHTGQAVLIADTDAKQLSAAYPNYYMDMTRFTGFLLKIHTAMNKAFPHAEVE